MFFYICGPTVENWPFLLLVQEPVIGLIKWLRPKCLKECSYVEKCAEF